MEAVKKELETLKDHPWAGVYYVSGGGLAASRHLAIAPKSGFAYTSRSDDLITGREVNGKMIMEHSLGDQNYGEVTWEDGRLKLSPILDVGTFAPLSTDFFLIPWDKKLYLVPTDNFIYCCNLVNRNYPEHHVMFGDNFLRDGQQIIGELREHPYRRLLSGKPEVPEKFKPYLLDKPVEGKVIAVGEPREVSKPYGNREIKVKETVVTINKRKQDGLLPGMLFYKTYRTEKTAGLYTIKLTKVSETESEGIVEHKIDEDSPQVDWAVYTNVRW
jgi:hypothetical protein